MSDARRFWVAVGDDPLIPDTGQDFTGYAYEKMVRASDYDTETARADTAEAVCAALIDTFKRCLAISEFGEMCRLIEQPHPAPQEDP